MKNYIEILQETFVVLAVTPYFRNKNREIAKAPKVYFIDGGARNFFINNFNGLELRDDAGRLFEGFVLSEVLKAGRDPGGFRYYRSKDGKEVDFIIEKVSKLLPVEVKFKTRLKAGDLAGLRYFLETYEIPKGFLVSLGELEPVGIVEEKIEKIDAFNAGKILGG